jgi:hypothetical protein
MLPLCQLSYVEGSEAQTTAPTQVLLRLLVFFEPSCLKI